MIDTFLGQELPPFRKTKTRKAVATPKFYLFDTGVWNAILGRFSISPRTREFGEALEHRVHHELISYLDYKRSDESLTYWRPQKQEDEVDFLIGDRIAIEVKGTANVSTRDTKGLMLLSQELRLQRRIIVCSEKHPRKITSGIEILPYSVFFQKLWSDEFI